ncbi:NAD-dependent succinate-semialdehyde dehydrogenase [Actinomadura decatromicini]|uniref:NAD-dependent succinate-semialdehyde dehydrogenase n=1 Tax=Actinomadura decatromicini TaxID=2604572 RepID=A0A5D3FT48_9ACTN|nr:NAD-dependent succinate-semialdehyde dehydrogenase [Actinomadura decatromicini]TYK51383.1 NAD-dependent succinate-semialdehyde dehydrogenase [Actinomadura decatromicini]
MQQSTIDTIYPPTGSLIGGEWRKARSGATFPVHDPATGEVIATVADADPEDAADAMEAAAASFPRWSATPPKQRAALLHSAFLTLQERAEEFARLITLEMGKPLAESRAEVAYAADFLRWYAEEAVRVSGTFRTAPDGTARHLTLRQPVGPCLLVTPWNFPLAMITRKVGPALAAGCTVILKPAEETPLSALRFAHVLTEVGVPAGVVNVLNTSRPGPLVETFLRDRRIRKLSFTGSTEVGRELLEQAAPGVLRTSMELGGNAPFIVFDDADVDAAVEGAVAAKLRNGGQSCVAANRFVVADSVAARFVDGLAERLRGQVVGPGTDPRSTLGPMINEKQRNRAVGLVDDAVSHGAVPAVHYRTAGPGDAFLNPVLLDRVPSSARIAREEIFGPVATVYRFSTEQEGLALANATESGLVGYVYTRDLNRALRAVEAMECGMVGVNRGYVSDASAPFGGVKQSGLGREGSEVGIQEYLETKYASIDAGALA